MRLREREALITEVCFGPPPGTATLAALGAGDRWALYREMVQGRIRDMVRAGLPRTAVALGDDALTQLFARWFAAAPPATRYLRDVALEFATFTFEGPPAAAGVAPWIADLARYEAARWRVAHLETGAPGPVEPFRFEARPRLNLSLALLSLDHPAHDSAQQASPQATRLAVYRHAEKHTVSALPLDTLGHALLDRWRVGTQSVVESTKAVAEELGLAIDAPLIRTLGTLTADLLERTVLLGSAPAQQ